MRIGVGLHGAALVAARRPRRRRRHGGSRELPVAAGPGTAGSGVAGTGGSAACDDSLIGWWPLNEGSGSSATDDSASTACARNDQTGTLIGGATWTTGRQGAGVAFDGSTGVVAVQPPDGSPLWNYPTAPMTMMAWIRPDAAA